MARWAIARSAKGPTATMQCQSLVFTSYYRRRAITGGKVEPALEAAHIRPVSSHG